MVDIDPLDLVKSTPLRCFGEEAQDQLVKYLQIFLLGRSRVNMGIRPEGRRGAWGLGARLELKKRFNRLLLFYHINFVSLDEAFSPMFLANAHYPHHRL